MSEAARAKPPPPPPPEMSWNGTSDAGVPPPPPPRGRPPRPGNPAGPSLSSTVACGPMCFGGEPRDSATSDRPNVSASRIPAWGRPGLTPSYITIGSIRYGVRVAGSNGVGTTDASATPPFSTGGAGTPTEVAGHEAPPLGDASNHEKERVDASTDAITMLLTPPPSSPHQHVGGGSGGDCCCGVVQFLSPSRIPLPAGAPDKTLPAAINRRGIFSRINSGEVARVQPVRDAPSVFRSTLEWSQARSPRAPPLASSCFSASSDGPRSATSVADASLPPPPPLPPRDGVSMRYKATASPPPPAAAPPRTPTSLLRRRLLVRAKPDLPSYLKFCSSPSASDSGSESAHLITPSASRDSSRDNLAEDEEASTASNPRRNTLERLQKFRWGGGGDKSKKSDSGGSGEHKKKPPRSSDKTESLRELTQRLKAHSVSPERKKAKAAAAAAAAAAAFTRDLNPPPSIHADPSVPSGPPAPLQASVGVARKDAANKEAAAGCEEDAGGGAAPAMTAIVGGGGNDHAVPGKDAASVENSVSQTAAMDSLRSCTKDLSPVIKEEDIFECENLRLPKPESRTIVGSYIQRTIPIRSASFSQVDFSPADGKYIHSSAKTSPFAVLTTAAVKSGLPLSNTSVITGGSLTLPRKRLPDISGSQTVSPSSSTAIGMEEPTGSTPSVDSAVGSDEGFVTSDLSKIPIAKPSGSADVGSDSSHKPSGARSLTYPLHRRGSHSDENIPYSSIDGNGLKSLYGAVVRELPEVLEESEPSASDSAAPGDAGDMRPSSSAQATDCSADFCAPDTVSLCEPSSTPPPRFYVGDDLEDTAKCVNTECATNNLSANESVARELADNARDEEQEVKAMKDTDGAVFRKSNSSDEEPLLSEQIDSDGWIDSMGGKDEKDKKSTQGRRSSGENDTDNDVYITRWPATEIRNSSQNDNEFGEKAEIEVPEETKKDIGPSICAQQGSNDQWVGEHSSEKVSNARSGDDSPRWSGEGEGDRSEWGSVPDEANSPDESRPRRPQWMPRASPRHVWPDRPRLVWQSSDEKDDEPSSIRPSPRRYHPLPRADSFSEGESDQGDRYPPASFREHTSSPSFFAPSDVSDSESRGGTETRSPHTPRRYSKRPLRGPYGQMLEAEMKKPETTRIFSKDDLKFLEEFVTPSPQQQPEITRDKQAARPASADPHDGANLVRPRALTTLSLDDSQLKGGYGRTGRSATTPPSPQPRTSPKRKVSANIPYAAPDPSSGGERTLVCHHRTTSSPSQLEGYARKAERQTTGNGVAPRAVPEPTPELLAAMLQGSSERLLEVNAVTSPPSTPTLPACPATVAAPNGTCASPQVTSASGTAAATTTVNTTTVTPNGNAVQHWKDTRTHVAVELLETERTYVESLQILVTKYLKPLKSPENAGLVDASLVDEIFYQVPAILSHHEVFLDQLKKRLDNWDVRQTVGDVFLDAFTKQTVIETYTSFINNWKTAKEVLKNTAQSKPAFAKFLEAMTREHKGKLSLDCLLIMPVQRIPRYELLIQTLVKHTDTTHPDYQLLLEAQREVHDLSLKINSTERETLKELEALIEGLINLVSPERAFLRHDLVTMASGQGTRKERALFLFSDLLVITSIKRRSATIRKPSTSCPGSLASTLEANKYKLLMRIPLDELEIIKAKDENVRRILREIEHLVEDVATLNQMSELVSTLHCPHSTLEDLVRDTLSTLNKQLTERQNCDSQLSYLELSLSPQSGPENNISVVFTKPDKKNSWEETFNEAKQKLALSADRRPVPEFLSPVPIRKTRAGLQFTCAAPTLGFNAFNMRDVWVCNSDGYVGQVCVLSLQPEPNVVSCNGVCNARILCIASIPAGVAGISSGNLCSSAPFTNSKPGISISVEDTDDGGGNIQLDSSSSDDDEDGDEGSSGGPGTEEEQKRIRSASDSMMSDSGLVSDDTDSLQPTMWLGTEDGCIHVYNCSDNIRIKKNKVKIQHGSSVHCIIYLDNRVFVSLANGDITVYVRDYSGGWNTSDPFAVSVGSAAMPVTRMLPIMGKLWCACHNYIKILNTISLEVESTFLVNNENTRAVTNMAASGFGVWISLQNSATIRLFHAVTHEILCDINVAPPVTKMLASCDDIIRQHKAACLRVTSLLACKDLLWVGTSAGVILTMPLPHVSASTTKLTNIPTPTGVPHGHTGHVRFLTCVETTTSSSTDSLDVRRSTHHRFSLKNKPDLIAHQGTSSSGAKLLVISGGDGYEDFRVSSVSEVVGREDATNHLLLWNV